MGTSPERPEAQDPAARSRRGPWPFVILAVVLATIAAGVVVLVAGGSEAEGQTVRFQAPTEPGPRPFTKPADVRGERKVPVGSGPYGGTGSDLVCDRELLVRSLRARPDRLRAWAAVHGLEPTAEAVARYIRRLRAVTLTRDTRVTNYSYASGSATSFQAVLQAGTAVLVDRDGNPVARCRCGNPLTEPVFYARARCIACPVDYVPPPPCDDPRDCYRRHPDPPPVRGATDFDLPGERDDRDPPPQTDPPPAPPEQSPVPPTGALQCDPPRSQEEFERCAGLSGPREPEGQAGPPTASFSPASGSVNDTYTISFANFPPGEPVNIHLTRPDGVEEDYAAQAGASGSGSFTFPRAQNPVLGTYDATVTNGPVLAAAQTTVR